MLTPSSNTVLEPTCAAMLAGMADVSAHFARFRVTQIALSELALRQFDEQPMLQAAELLADAKVNAICWNGTSAGWLGLEADRALCRAYRGLFQFFLKTELAQNSRAIRRDPEPCTNFA